jgi:outer membrane protein OmpA-like peptidoglycan-associated protein
MTTRRVTTTLLVAILAAGFGVTAGLILLAPAGTSRAVVLRSPPGRGLERPWWESITVADPTPNTATVTYVVPADLLFATDSATVDETGQHELVDLARTQLRGASAVVIAGATDSRDTRVHNLALSQARADATTATLVAAGIDPNIIRTEAWADDHPAADEHGPDPATAQARNRRVEITVTK